MKLLVLLLTVSSSHVQSYTVLLPKSRTLASSQSSLRRWMTAAKDDATSKKDPIEVVEEYRDNLSNSRTAPGHHDGQEKKVKLFSCDVLDFS
jgi:hypothetical protein